MNVSPPPNVIYLPGLRTAPDGALGSWLTARYGAHGVELGAEAMREASDRFRARGESIRWPFDDEERLYREPLQRVRQALAEAPAPRIVVSRSFGCAVLTKLAWGGEFSGPNVMIASAARKFTAHDLIPSSCPTILIHGRSDPGIPLASIRELATASGDHVQLWEVEGGHALEHITEDGTVARALERLGGVALTPEDRR